MGWGETWQCVRAEWATHRWHMLEAIGALGTALGAICIPIILERANVQRHDSEVATRTLQTMNEVNRHIAEILQPYPSLQTRSGPGGLGKFSAQEAETDAGLSNAARRLLNEYEFVCLGGNKQLLNSEVMKDLRSHAIRDTWIYFKDFILARRAIDKAAWTECERWLNDNKIEGWTKW